MKFCNQCYKDTDRMKNGRCKPCHRKANLKFASTKPDRYAEIQIKSLAKKLGYTLVKNK